MESAGQAAVRDRRASALELFYDLVFVFAVTQVSHLLLAHLDWKGAGQAAVVTLAVWWAWNYTTWATNELDPEATPVILLVLALMLGSLLLAIAIPQAWGERGLLFACAYVAMQVGRSSYLTFVAARPGTLERARASRILIWFVAAGVLWIAGGVAHGTGRALLWVAALAVDYGAPLVTFRVPGLPRVEATAWNVQTGHFTERFQAFVIIALGESIVVIGATTAELSLDAANVIAFVIAFAGAAALWWLYFGAVARIGEEQLERAAERTMVARDAFTYLHVVIVAGVIVSAVGDELVIVHPTHHLTAAERAIVAGGPALYLLAHVLFRLRLAGTLSPRRTAGLVACLVIGAVSGGLAALAVGGLVTAVLATVVAAELVAR